jgi:ATP-dependent protease HslVU (ClpYQ) peptidase subunit
MEQLVKCSDSKRQRLIQQNSAIIFTAGFVSYLQTQLEHFENKINAKQHGIKKLLPIRLRKELINAKRQKKAKIIGVWESMEAAYVLDLQGSAKTNTAADDENFNFSKTNTLTACI